MSEAPRRELRGRAGLVLDTLVRELSAMAPKPLLSPHRRERVIQGAFREADARANAPRFPLLSRKLALGAATLALLGLFLFLAVTPPSELERSPVDEHTLEPPSGQLEGPWLLHGVLRVGNAIVTGGTRIVGDGPWVAKGAAILIVGPATVDLSPETIVRWHEESSTLWLEDGAVQLVVAPTQNQSFKVATDRFEVEVVGTTFQVTRASVNVINGVLIVWAPGQRRVLARLVAGETWSPPPLMGAVEEE